MEQKSTFQREDDLGFMAALKVCIPAGLGLWLLILLAIQKGAGILL